MSAIASVLVAMGHTVSGSDLKESPGLDRLRSLGVTVSVGHDGDQVGDVAAVAISTAIPDHNPEVVRAGERSIPVLRRAEVLAAITETRRTIAVAGTHGKTTTASMLAVALLGADLDPSFIIGGEVNEIGGGAAWSAGDLFVVEADESDGTFLELHRDGAIITNIEPDHLEHYGGFPELLAAFDRFVRETAGPKVICLDDAHAADLVGRLDAEGGELLTYGTADRARFRMTEVSSGRDGVSFVLADGDSRLGVIELAVPGMHNARNAAGATVAALAYGAEFDKVAATLARYAGVARRYEYRGEVDGITFIDDYAHLPTEVEAALGAAADGNWPRIVCVFQPHRYSRTQAVGGEFGGAFAAADEIIITGIYSSGEAPRPGVSGKLVLNAVLDADPHASVAYLPHRSELASYLRRRLRAGDLCLTLGAGDLSSLPDELQASWVSAS